MKSNMRDMDNDKKEKQKVKEEKNVKEGIK
jgi:hypothetical protein